MNTRRKYFGFWLIFLVLGSFQLFLLINSTFTPWPEMLLYPYFMGKGFLLYRDVINPYFPLLPVVLNNYFSLVGLSVENLKILTFLIILLNDLLVLWIAYLLSKKSYKAFTSLAIYIMLQYSYGGNGLWFELFLSPVLISGLFIVFLSKKRLLIFLASILIGISILIKQNVALFYIPVFIYYVYQKRFRDFGVFLLGQVLVGIALYLYLTINQVVPDFFKWAVLLPLTYGSKNGFVLLPTIKQYLLIIFPLFSLVGYVYVSKNKLNKVFWGFCFLISLGFAFPRYENFHLQVVVMLSAIFVVFLNKKMLTIFFIISLLISFSSFTKLYNHPDRFIDQNLYQFSEIVKQHNAVYLLNAPELAYLYSNKIPPKPWAINFPWYFESHNFEKEFIDSLKEQKIDTIIIGDKIGGGKYDLGNYIPAQLMGYIEQSYTLVSKIESYQIWQRKSQ
jgi:hypothetical protein